MLSHVKQLSLCIYKVKIIAPTSEVIVSLEKQTVQMSTEVSTVLAHGTTMCLYTWCFVLVVTLQITLEKRLASPIPVVLPRAVGSINSHFCFTYKSHVKHLM